jgi:hypothetical protein
MFARWGIRDIVQACIVLHTKSRFLALVGMTNRVKEKCWVGLRGSRGRLSAVMRWVASLSTARMRDSCEMRRGVQLSSPRRSIVMRQESKVA